MSYLTSRVFSGVMFCPERADAVFLFEMPVVFSRMKKTSHGTVDQMLSI